MRVLSDRRSLSFLVAATIGLATVLLMSPSLLSQSSVVTTVKEPTSYREIVKKVLPAIVSIESRSPITNGQANWQKVWPDEVEWPMDLRRFFGNTTVPEMSRKGFGSGFIVDPTGVVVTNHHVVQNAKRVTVRLQDGRVFESKDIKTDPKSDLAVIRIDAPTTLPSIEFAESTAVEIGDRVLAFGSPFGLTGSVTSGIISGKGRHPNLTMYEDYLQTDAAINPGNSGGPLVNLEGKVVGVNTAMKSLSGGSQGVGFSIPCGYARDIISKLQRSGTVQRGYLGVQIRALDAAIAERLGNPQGQGVVVARVMEDSPAAQAGILAGDVITTIDGQTVKEPGELQRRIADHGPSKSVNLKVLRDGKSLEVLVTLRDQPETAVMQQHEIEHGSISNGERISKLGFEVAATSDELARRFGFERERMEGALVTRIDANSLAAQAGIIPGTIITKVDDTRVKNAVDAKQAIEKASLQKGILFQVHYPQSGTGYVMVKSNVSR
jgi:serine protease Do